MIDHLSLAYIQLLALSRPEDDEICVIINDAHTIQAGNFFRSIADFRTSDGCDRHENICPYFFFSQEDRTYFTFCLTCLEMLEMLPNFFALPPKENCTSKIMG